MTSLLPCETVETQPDPDAAVIWLHGLGADGFDFVPIVPELELPRTLAVRFIFPHAPKLPVTIYGGALVPAWYDIMEMSIERKIDFPQIQKSADAVLALIAHERARGIAANRIILAGFSQGGAVVYHAALSCEQTLGGLMALSTYVATSKTLEVNPANAALPVHVFHGTGDDVVPEVLGQQAVAWLKAKGLSPEYKTYPMAHAVHPQEIEDIRRWLVARLS